MGQGAHHLGLSLAPATDNSFLAGASCASSLPAGAVVVTTRLAQRCCRSYAGRIAAAIVLAGRCADFDRRLTCISEPCGCRFSGDRAGACARSGEHRPMRLRASSGLTQPTWNTVRYPRDTATACSGCCADRAASRVTGAPLQKFLRRWKGAPAFAGCSCSAGKRSGQEAVSSANDFARLRLRRAMNIDCAAHRITALGFRDRIRP